MCNVNQKIKDLNALNKTPCLQGSESADSAILAMNNANVNIIGVSCEQKFVGTFTRKDFEKQIVRRNLNPQDTTLYEVMAVNSPTIQFDKTVKETYEAMLSHQWNYISVLNGTLLCGIIMIADLGHDIIESFELVEKENDLIKYYIHSGEAYGTGDYKH